MISHFPDINVWIALTVEGHVHNEPARRWLRSVRREDRLVFSRYTQLAFLRLLTNASVMKEAALTTMEAWAAYDLWLQDPRVEFHREPPSLETALRQATAPFAGQPASKQIGDSYLLAFAREAGATLITFDQTLCRHAAAFDCPATSPK